MKIKNIFKKWNNGKIDETKLFYQNQSLFDKMDNELKNIYYKNMLISSLDIILMDNDFECVRNNLIDLFNDNVDGLTNDLIKWVKKYDNVGVKYNETK